MDYGTLNINERTRIAEYYIKLDINVSSTSVGNLKKNGVVVALPSPYRPPTPMRMVAGGTQQYPFVVGLTSEGNITYHSSTTGSQQFEGVFMYHY